jgi:hypothetical protein
MKAIIRILKQKSTWAGIGGIATGAVLIINGDLTTGVQTVIGGFAIIFLREAIANK